MARIVFATKLLLLTAATMWFASCGAPADQPAVGNTPTQPEEPEAQAEPEMIEDDEVDFMLPSPLQIAAIFNKAGLEYAEGLTNPTTNSEQYTSTEAQSLAFGVYSADLSYCVQNGQSQESRNYLSTIRDLSDKLGMSSIFSTEELMNSFERNIDNRDSTLYILATIQEQLDDYLAENDQEYKTSVFFAGAFVEALYLGSKVGASKDDKSLLARRLVEQLAILENLNKALTRYPNPNEELKWVMKNLDALNSQFNELEAIKAMQEKGEEFDFEQATFTDEELDKLSKTIEDIRTKIVNG